jgi:hypothetical protein
MFEYDTRPVIEVRGITPSYLAVKVFVPELCLPQRFLTGYIQGLVTHLSYN